VDHAAWRVRKQAQQQRVELFDVQLPSVVEMITIGLRDRSISFFEKLQMIPMSVLVKILP